MDADVETCCALIGEQDSPTRITSAPSSSRRSTGSLNHSHAIAMVANPSRFSNKEADAAVVLSRPNISSTGATTPPVKTIIANQGRSARFKAASRRSRSRIKYVIVRPSPEPPVPTEDPNRPWLGSFPSDATPQEIANILPLVSLASKAGEFRADQWPSRDFSGGFLAPVDPTFWLWPVLWCKETLHPMTEQEEQHEHDHHGHGHAGHDHAGSASEHRLRIALGLLFVFTLVEAIGGFWSNSIALLAEAAHMLADSASLVLAIVAIRVGRQPANAVRTYGSRRYQTLAAYTNGLVLLALTAWFVVEAARRLIAPTEVNGKVMLGIALIGGIANVAAFVALSGASSLNEKGARAHVLSDLLGSGAAAAAAGVILTLRWLPADPILSILISALIARSGWQLTRDAGHILLEGTPPGCDIGEIEKDLKGLPGISSIHHIHAWSLTGESPILTLHAKLKDGANRQQALTGIVDRLSERFGVEHATVQIEDGACAAPAMPETCHDVVGLFNPTPHGDPLNIGVTGGSRGR